MDKSLDEIIAAKPRTTRRGQTGAPRRGPARIARAQVLGKAVPAPAQKARAVTVTAAKTATTSVNTDKIIVSNLPIDVNEAQVKELFTTTVGPLREVTLHYDASGKSKGVAAVKFSRKGDANKAYTQYNNRLIDGKRPMKIEIVVDPVAAIPLSSRVAPVPATAPATNGTRRVSAGGRQRRGRVAGGAKRAERPQKSVADLDAEMEDYTASASAPAAAPAAAA